MVPRSPTARLVLALFGLAALNAPKARGQAVLGPPQPTERRIVFAVDGSGLLRSISDDLRHAIADARLPLDVESFAWSHGPGRVLSDLHGHEHQQAKGQELARMILKHRSDCPSCKIYVVCHSSGAAVVLAAAAQLPAACIERIVLLAPALAPSCDIRAALRCARLGVDSFHSQNDTIGVVLAFMGNADGQFLVSAGSVGFSPSKNASSDDALYQKLHQHGWEWEMSKCGYYGGHFGCTHSAFLRAYVVPLLSAQ
jgi:pimeloyl-ACP methyl ester carboxylesterase